MHIFLHVPCQAKFNFGCRAYSLRMPKSQFLNIEKWFVCSINLFLPAINLNFTNVTSHPLSQPGTCTANCPVSGSVLVWQCPCKPVRWFVRYFYFAWNLSKCWMPHLACPSLQCPHCKSKLAQIETKIEFKF